MMNLWNLFRCSVKLNINFASFYIPKYDPLKPLGEDAHFISHKQNIFGVADGVGGWAEKGIDAGEFSRELMANCADAAAAGPVDPTTVLTSAYLKTKNTVGSSTACVIALRDNKLHAANVGDSGFMVFREKKLVYASAVQQHHFNCPYQLVGGDGDRGVRVGCYWKGKTTVEAGDIVVAATDGFLDNVHVSEMEDVIVKTTAFRVEPGVLARRLAGLALKYSVDRRRSTPFAVAARAAGFEHDGGKIDDITVIVGHVIAS